METRISSLSLINLDDLVIKHNLTIDDHLLGDRALVVVVLGYRACRRANICMDLGRPNDDDN
jgi:hypothetical protein